MLPSESTNTPADPVGDVEEVCRWREQSVFSLDAASVPPAELREAFKRLALLYQLANQICSQTDEEEVFQTILAAVVELLNTERAFIATASKGKLVARAEHNIKRFRIVVGTDGGDIDNRRQAYQYGRSVLVRETIYISNLIYCD